MSILKIAAKKHFRKASLFSLVCWEHLLWNLIEESILQVKLKDKLLKQLTVMIAEDISQLNEVHKKLTSH